MVGPENSVVPDYQQSRDRKFTSNESSGVVGMGRPRVELSFIADLMDRMCRVPTAASYAAVRLLATLAGRRLGGSH